MSSLRHARPVRLAGSREVDSDRHRLARLEGPVELTGVVEVADGALVVDDGLGQRPLADAFRVLVEFGPVDASVPAGDHRDVQSALDQVDPHHRLGGRIALVVERGAEVLETGRRSRLCGAIGPDRDVVERGSRAPERQRDVSDVIPGFADRVERRWMRFLEERFGVGDAPLDAEEPIAVQGPGCTGLFDDRPRPCREFPEMFDRRVSVCRADEGDVLVRHAVGVRDRRGAGRGNRSDTEESGDADGTSGPEEGTAGERGTSHGSVFGNEPDTSCPNCGRGWPSRPYARAGCSSET